MTPTPLFQPRRELGRTGFRVTQLGIGDLADRTIPLERCVTTVRRALDAGLNVIDTAPNYEDGYSEQIVGAALKGRRSGVFVIDKVDQLQEPVAPQVEASLRRLELEMVDLFVFHSVSALADWERIAAPGAGMDQLARCVQQGKVRFCGISSHHPEVLRAAIESSRCDVVMFAIGPFVDERYIKDILPLSRAHRVGSVCFKTFGAGKLLGDTSGYSRPLVERPRGKFSSGGTEAPASSQLPRLTVTECVHYTLSLDPDVALLGLGFENEQDAAFAAAKSFVPLGAEQLEAIRGRAREAIAGKGPCWWDPQPLPA
ncbi:MAG: aldo/keto reductase [Verrucomicrobia bacterium]|nr:aldo/keto reductase [Verrucomicrobiota bacterium]